MFWRQLINWMMVFLMNVLLQKKVLGTATSSPIISGAIKLLNFYQLWGEIQEILIILRFSSLRIASRNSLLCFPFSSKCCIMSLTGVWADPHLWWRRCKYFTTSRSIFPHFHVVFRRSVANDVSIFWASKPLRLTRILHPNTYALTR